MINKETYTKIFLKAVEKSTDPATVALFQRAWWFGRRSKKVGGLRLSDEGYLFLTNELDLHEHEIILPAKTELSPSVLLFLDQYLEHPYYLTPKCLIVFGERESFKLQMFSDDIRKFGLIKAMNIRAQEEENYVDTPSEIVYTKIND